MVRMMTGQTSLQSVAVDINMSGINQRVMGVFDTQHIMRMRYYTGEGETRGTEHNHIVSILLKATPIDKDDNGSAFFFPRRTKSD